jgi:cytochrome b561
MRIKNSNQNYGIIAISFHWILAILIIGILGVGFYMTGLENNPDKYVPCMIDIFKFLI